MKAKLASLIAIALCAAMPALAQKRWTGNGSGYWTPTSDTANWNDKSGGATGYFFLYDSSGYGSKTVKFSEHTGIGNNIVSVQHKTGTTAESPIVFLADEDEYGFTSTSRLDAGQYLNGHLDIQRGTFACSYIQIGNNSEKGASDVDCLIKVGGSGHNASLTANGGNSTIYRGKLLVGAKGSFFFNRYFTVGNWSGKTGTLEVDGGAVTNSAYYAALGGSAGSTGVLTVKNGGKYENTGSGGDGGGLIVGAHGSGELNVDGGEVIMSVPINVCYYNTGTAAINVTGGGIIRCGGFIYDRSGESNPKAVTISIDGGTLQAAADNAAFVPNAENMTVTVGENGAMIDNGGHDITLASSISGTGALTLSGSGKTTFGAGVSVSPSVQVASGTTLSVTGVQTTSFASLSFAAGSTFDIASYSAGLMASATSLALPGSGTVALTLNGGAFARGQYGIIEAPGITAEDGAKFAPSAGGLDYVWSVRGNVLVLTVGAALDAHVWTGVAGDGRMGNGANWAGGEVPAEGSPVDFSTVAADTTIIADAGHPFGAATMGAGVIAFTGSLPVDSFSDMTKLAVGADSTVTIAGDVSNAENNVLRVCHTVAAGGKLRIDGKLTIANTSGDFWFETVRGGGAIIAAGGIDIDTTRWVVVESAALVLGESGISFKKAGTIAFRSSPVVYSLGPKTVLGGELGGKYIFYGGSGNAFYPLHICTTQYGTDIPATIEFSGDINGQKLYFASLVVSGCGRAEFTATAKTNRKITVQDAATASFAPGFATYNIYGESLNVESGAVVETAAAGVSAAVFPTVNLAAGSILSFYAGSDGAGKFAFGSARTIGGAVKVKLAEGSAPAVGTQYVLTSNANLSDAEAANFALADGVRGTLSVVGGELVYTPPNYFIIKVK